MEETEIYEILNDAKYTSQMKRILSRTVKILNLDKYAVKTLIEALKSHTEALRTKNEGVKTSVIDVFVTIKFSQDINLSKFLFIKMKDAIKSNPNDCNVIITNQAVKRDKAGYDHIFYKEIVEKKRNIKDIIKQYDYIYADKVVFRKILRKFPTFSKKFNQMLVPYKEEGAEELIESSKLLRVVPNEKKKSDSVTIRIGEIDQSLKCLVKNVIIGIYRVVMALLCKSEKHNTVAEIEIFTDYSLHLNVYANNKLNIS